MSSIVIKLSGEGLSGGGEKYAKETLEAIANQISELLKNGTQIALVVGGGNLFRGGDLAGDIGIERPTADYIGMLAT
ncbi:UMP kinase, partial [bacterium]|nr:UMP kinase [bacterium]